LLVLAVSLLIAGLLALQIGRHGTRAAVAVEVS